ncbi:hypothetical protein CPB83DRAFT_813039 [Crepidotus variabilis]|uniref:Uncharacterized protein n=1 Tax=Crepidotus variabilis TaxID=179855 RepID=A0A9P6EHP6_9AGAR|nr:hypothetical protein CPB83DRAFT_813039 [Crepidotus variabilis]
MEKLSLKSLLAFPKRYTRLFLLCFFVAALFYIFAPEGNAGSPSTIELATGNVSGDSNYPPIEYPEPQMTPDNTDNKPPLFKAYRAYEDKVAQWNMEKYGKPSDKYIFVANHAWGAGWGNIMQEMVFHTLLASGSGRGYVWDDYTWGLPPQEYSDFNGKTIPARVPLSTMIGGYLLGLPVPQANGSSPILPPSISRRQYESMCPESHRVVIDRALVQEHHGQDRDLNWNASGKEVLDAWLAYLNKSDIKDKKCVEIKFGSTQVFDIWILNNERVHTLLDTIYRSPVLTGWGWSKLIQGVFERNVAHFVSAKSLLSSAASTTGSRFSRLFSNAETTIRIDGRNVPSSVLRHVTNSQDSTLPLLVLHLRRGDYGDHCDHLAEYRSQYIGISMLPEFQRDSFVPPEYLHQDKKAPNSTEGVEFVENVDAMKPIYRKHCFPDIYAIKRRVREVLRDYEQHLALKNGRTGFFGSQGGFWPWIVGRAKAKANKRVKKIYIMSNGDKEWLKEVSEALKDDADRSIGARVPSLSREEAEWEFLWSWDEISSSRDIVVGWEENRVSQILDMYVAQRAELFVGNGFSTLTSNIVMLRRKNGYDPIQTRFW